MDNSIHVFVVGEEVLVYVYMNVYDNYYAYILL